MEVIPEGKNNYWRDAVRKIDEAVYLKISGNQKSSPVKSNNSLPKMSGDFESNSKDGEKKYRYTSYFERKAINRSKAIECHGYTCMACGFNFEDVYGGHGKNFIHVHHVQPVSKLTGGMIIDPKKDLIVLCPNCHSMIHRDKKKTLTLDELKKLIK